MCQYGNITEEVCNVHMYVAVLEIDSECVKQECPDITLSLIVKL